MSRSLSGWLRWRWRSVSNRTGRGSCPDGGPGCSSTLPQRGGRHRHGDRQVSAAIVFVATMGCTWRQPPPDFGPYGPTAHRRFTE
ncbi:transposase [Streptomyces sp. ASQP_92]|uniref:transposase n=1 Tax=Streptomyces sp. ASQP_92 TaxID=2979116 RepID=UPI0037DA7665